jgi:hypothetical protein
MEIYAQPILVILRLEIVWTPITLSLVPMEMLVLWTTFVLQVPVFLEHPKTAMIATPVPMIIVTLSLETVTMSIILLLALMAMPVP